ncbi:MAG: hypothetical protein IPK72_05100 [Candidatus Eisenbacteria bacterium]|nr:hypothetical protein [Candidatus Eisenbacteria bacterium]
MEQLLVVGDRLIARGRFRLEDRDASLLSWTGADWVELEGAEELVATSAFADGSKLLVGGTRRVNESDTSVVEWWDGVDWHQWTPPDEARDCKPLALIHGAFYIACRWSDASIQSSSLLRAEDGGLTRYRLPEETALYAGLELDGQFLGVLQNLHSSQDGWATRLVRPSGDSLVVVSPALPIYPSDARVAGSTVVLTRDGKFSSLEMHRWDGAEWMPYPTPGAREARYLPVSDRDVLYAQFEDSIGGSFGLWADDGGRGEWRRVPLDLQPSYGAVRSIVTLKSALVLGGSFRSVDHQGAAGVAVETPDGWRSTAPGLGPDNTVSDLVPGHDGFWCLGSFQSLGDLWSPGAAFWNGGAWSHVLAPPFNGPIVGSVIEDELWVLRSNAYWRAEGDVAAARLQEGAWVVQPSDDRIARWQLSRLLRYAGRAIAVGEISMTDGSRRPLVEWSMGAWRPVESIPAGSAVAAEAWRGKLIVAGRFRPDAQPYGSLGDLLAWDGSTSELLSPRPAIAGSRTLGSIHDLAAHADLLLIAGDFDYLGEVYTPGLAAWDGERIRPYAQPSPMSPRPRSIRRLLVDQGEVFAAGEFVDAENRSVQGSTSGVANAGLRWGASTAS